MSFGETAWVDRNLKSAWDRISEQVPESWMPRRQPGRKFSVEEFACGHYGCVMPTNEPDLVFKLTSDITEARFVAMAMSLDETEGMVDYKKIFALRDQTHRQRPVFVLWRDEAWDVGFLTGLYPGGYGGQAALIERAGKFNIMPGQVRSLREGEKYLDEFLKHARDVREKMDKQLKKAPPFAVLQAVQNAYERWRYDSSDRDPKHWRGLDRIGIGLAKCAELAELMANTDVIYPVGVALDYYMGEGILLADVHLNNIGLDKDRRLIITDPGHAVPFDTRWSTLPEVPII